MRYKGKVTSWNDKRTRSRARDIRFSTDPKHSAGRPNSGAISLALAGVFLLIVSGAFLAGKIPGVILAVYVLTNIIALVAYWRDKSAAVRERRRTPESTLHIIGLVGGWPAALLAQKVFRHKSRKIEFQRVFWGTVILNCAATAWLLFR